MAAAARSLGRVLVAGFRTRPRAVLSLALLGLLILFFSNSDMGGDPHSPRGDGTYRPVLARGDGHMLYLMARSLVLDQDLVFDNDLARFGDPFHQPRTSTGRKSIPHPIGPALVWTPFLGTAHAGSKVANALGADIPAHGYTIVHQRVVFVTSVLFGFGAVFLGYLLSRRMIGGRWAPVYAAVAVLYGSSLTYYATYMPSYGHAMDAFFCAAFLAYWASTYGDMRWRRHVVLGLLLGVAALIRSQEVLLGVVVAFELAVRGLSARPAERGWPAWLGALMGRGLVALAVTLVVFTPQMIAWKLLYGEYITTPMGEGFMRYGHPEILELLFSSRNGWLSTTPLAYAGVIGLVFVPRRARLIAAGLGLALIVQIWVNASVFDWWAGASFGQRRLCSMTVILVFGLAALIRACSVAASCAPRRLPAVALHVIAILVLGWFVAWNMALLSKLRRGKAAGHPVAASCCARVPQPFKAIAQPIYDLMGNPFSLPASAYFALRHGVDIHRWDLVAGNYVQVVHFDHYRSGAYRRQRARWNIPGPGFKHHIIGGLGPAQTETRHKRGFRWTLAPRAEVLVPLHLAEAHRITLSLSPNTGQGEPLPLSISFNGRAYIERALAPGWTELSFDVPAAEISVGMNVLAVRARPSPYRDDLDLPPPPEPVDVGVAIGPMWIDYLPE